MGRLPLLSDYVGVSSFFLTGCAPSFPGYPLGLPAYFFPLSLWPLGDTPIWWKRSKPSHLLRIPLETLICSLASLCRGQGGYPASDPLFPSLNCSGLTNFPGQLREAVDHDPFPHLAGGASPKRELEGEPLYRRALRECGLPGCRPWGVGAGRTPGRELEAQIPIAKGRSEEMPLGEMGWRSGSRALRLGVAGAERELPRRRSGGCSQPRCPPPGCVDMLSLQGQFTFTADWPQLHCATFFIAEPEEFITIHYDLVSIDCLRGDILQVRRPRTRWARDGSQLPSSESR